MKLLESYLDFLQEGLINESSMFFKLLDFKGRKFLYVNKYDVNEITAFKFLGYIFLFENDYQWKDFLNGNENEVPIATNLFGKDKFDDVLDMVKDSKVLDKAVCKGEFGITNEISNIRGSKIFSKDDSIFVKSIFFQKSSIPIIGVLAFPMKMKIKLVKK